MSRYDSASSSSGLFIELWSRKSGGFSVAHSAWFEHGWRADAATFNDVEAAADYLEEVCASLRDMTVQLEVPVRDPEGILQLVEAQTSLRADILGFEALVSRALTDWVRTTASPQGSIAMKRY